jgi:hypothetical protein
MCKRSTTAKGAEGAQRTADSTAWDSDDPEIRALSRNAAFRELLRHTAERARREGTVTLEETKAFRDLTPEDDAEGERLLAELERQTEEEEAARLAARSPGGSRGANGAAMPTKRSAPKAQGPNVK